MIRSLLNAVRRSAAGVGRTRSVLALAPALLLLAGQLPAVAAPPSQIVEEHLVAQAGLSIGFAWSSLAQFFEAGSGGFGTSCAPEFGGTSSSAAGINESSGSTGLILMTIYYDSACQSPYFVDDAQGPVSSPAFTILTSTGHFVAPNGALIGVLSQSQQLQSSGGSTFTLSGKGTYKTVAGLGQAPVRVGLACSLNLGATDVITCQEGIAQDFPALKMSLGTIASMTFVLSSPGPHVVVTGTSAKLVTGKLGGLSLTVNSPTSLGFQGQHAVVGTGTTNGAAPLFGAIPPATTAWGFNDSQHTTKFSISTAGNLRSSGKVLDTKTHATATITVDQSGTGTIAYSDKSKAKITNWTLSD